QDFLFLPVGAASYTEALEWTAEVYRCLGEVLTAAGYEGYLVGDEGGYGPRLASNEQAVEMCLAAFRKAGLAEGRQAALALDVAASHFWRDGRYHLRADGLALDAVQMVAFLRRCCAFPVLSVEDGLAEDDFDGWRVLTQELGGRVQLVGDDLFCTHEVR